jgi:hypothetical protein
VVLTSAVDPDSMGVDRVVGTDGVIRTDGRNDAAFDVTVNGPLVSLSLIVTDAQGKARANQIWDTNIGDTPIPSGIGVSHERGAQTWQVGVFEDGTMKNREVGSLPALDGRHQLRLYASDSGYFHGGVTFRWVLERPDGGLAYGPVFSYPAQ